MMRMVKIIWPDGQSKVLICDKIIIINRMQSGTVLHLALLKKLSNHYPSGQLTSKYHRFKQNYATRCQSRSPKNTSSEKYEPSDRLKPYEGTSKPRHCRMERKFQKVFQNWQLTDSLTAWNVDNQQQVSYTEKLKRDKYDFFPRLIEANRKNRNAIKFKRDISQRQVLSKNNKVYNFLVQQVNKTKHHFWTEDKPRQDVKSRKEFRSQDKENNVDLHPLVMGYKNNRKAKSNDRSTTASPFGKRVSSTLCVKD